VIDRSKASTADDEYTVEQRRIIDARLAEGLADIKAGRVYGPFYTHEEMMASLRNHGKKAELKTNKRRSR
jgi:predicted transcriptional regulator